MRINLRFIAGSIVDNTLFFSSIFFNGLFRMDLDTEEIIFVDVFDEAPLEKTYLHRVCLTYDRWLIFLPHNHDKINFVNIDTLEQKTIRVSDCSKPLMIADAVIVGDALYVFPAIKEQLAMIVHLNKFEVEANDIFNEWLRTEAPESPNKDGILCLRAVLNNDTVYMGLNGQKGIIRYDTKTNDISIIETNLNKINAVYKGKDGIWINDRTNGHAEFLGNGMIEEYEKNNKFMYQFILDAGDFVYAVPGKAYYIKMIKGIGSPKELDYPELFKGFDKNSRLRFFGFNVNNDRVYLFPFSHDGILVICGDAIKLINTEYEFDPSDKSFERLTMTIRKRGTFLNKYQKGQFSEGPGFGLEMFLEWIK